MQTIMLSGSRYLLGICIAFLLAGMLSAHLPNNEEFISPEYITEFQDHLLISNKTGNEIIFLDTKSNKVDRKIKLDGSPGKPAVYDNGKYLVVPIAQSEGKLEIIDLKNDKSIAEIEVGHTPVSVLISENRAFVLNKFSGDISVIDLKRKVEITRIPAGREPAGAVISSDGNYLFVANSLPDMRATDNLIASTVSVINIHTLKKEKDLLLPNGSNGLKDICLSNDGKFAYLTHILGHYQLVTSQIERGWINTNAFSIIDVENQSFYATVLLDDIDQGAANPWGISCTSDDTKLLVALAGTNELCIIDRIGMHGKMAASIQSLVDVKNDFSFLYGLKKRVKTEGLGSRGVIESRGRVFISNYFSGSISTLSLDEQSIDLQAISLGNQADPDFERLGEMYFHDATVCYQHWQSCSSCHPDARTDALNWDLLNDGMGNPKNTKSLVLSHQTPPTMITGIRADAETCVRAGIKYILFAQGPEEEARCIDSYLKALQPIPSPCLVNGELSEAAIQGEKIFQSAGCNDCHSGKNYTDMNKYDVGTGTGREEERQFDTPSLREAWRNAPYLYDGRALTLKEVITRFNKDDKHGTTSDLTDKDLDALSEYLKSI